MSYDTEFPGFTLGVPIPPDWSDNSWHNDQSPSWYAANDRFLVFVDHVDPADSEQGDMPLEQYRRFSVYQVDAHGQLASDPLLRSNDWNEILACVATNEPSIRLVTPKAMDAFFGALAAEYPSASASALDPEDLEAFRQAAETVTRCWVHRNVPRPT